MSVCSVPQQALSIFHALVLSKAKSPVLCVGTCVLHKEAACPFLPLPFPLLSFLSFFSPPSLPSTSRARHCSVQWGGKRASFLPSRSGVKPSGSHSRWKVQVSKLCPRASELEFGVVMVVVAWGSQAYAHFEMSLIDSNARWPWSRRLVGEPNNSKSCQTATLTSTMGLGSGVQRASLGGLTWLGMSGKASQRRQL